MPEEQIQETTAPEIQQSAPQASDDVLGRGPEGSPVSDAERAASAPTEQAPSPEPTPEAPPTPDPSAGWRSIREAAEQTYRVQFPAEVQDDHQALAYLVEQARQADIYAQVGRQVAPHAKDVQEFLASKAKPQPEAPSPWDQPEWDERWSALVEPNAEAGILVGKPGVPPAIVDAANRYLEWQRRVQRDPAGYQEHLFNKKFLPQVESRIQQEREQMRQQVVVEDIIRKNSSWLYQKDEQGRHVAGPDGQPALSQAGLRYSQIVQEVRGYGVTDPRHLDQLALRQLQAEIALAQQSKSATPAAAPPQTRNAQTPPNRNAAGTLPARERSADPAASTPSGAGLSLKDMMARQLADFSDKDFERY